MFKQISLFGILALLSACANTTPQATVGPLPDNTPVEETEALSTPAVLPQAVRADLEDYGPAPELENEVWLNTEQPLHLADLRGKVVLIDMWTFG